ncbi:CDAN1-interacting nuclease 1 isoform X2 [Procambarus clarkii]|uniref:CDAN1-interacting nuclease 1 isoform X2 n=1 Tax=Procambarus clarkii TaxID=6728 RepID=UPI001E6700CD|nr:CDAN1-interacting nuclease 1-like isoform X1 [Procambarus clarkii]
MDNSGFDCTTRLYPNLKMKFQQYEEVIQFINTKPKGNVVAALVQRFPGIKAKTLGSIWAQDMQRKVKKNFHRINVPERASEIYRNYVSCVEAGDPPGILVKMAVAMDYSSSMLAKLILEQYLHANCPDISVSKSQVNRLLRDTTKIEDRDLSIEVYLCLLDDDVYGPFADSIKHSVGHEYEFLLRRELEKLNISYKNEDDLRLRGYDKTPDIKLDIPIAVDGKVVNWIESKASFGDEESHRTYLKDQFWSYWNRFGPGLVIYWFGFIEELDEHRDKGIMLRDSFPSNIVFMDPLSIAQPTCDTKTTVEPC